MRNWRNRFLLRLCSDIKQLVFSPTASINQLGSAQRTESSRQHPTHPTDSTQQTVPSKSRPGSKPTHQGGPASPSRWPGPPIKAQPAQQGCPASPSRSSHVVQQDSFTGQPSRPAQLPAQQASRPDSLAGQPKQASQQSSSASLAVQASPVIQLSRAAAAAQPGSPARQPSAGSM